VVLAHCYYRGPGNIHPLRDLLAEMGYRVAVPRLPTTFGSIDDNRRVLEKTIAGLDMGGGALNLVGHSFGGLVIRAFLAANETPPIGRCVLIGTPNHGTRLADVGRIFGRPLFPILKPLNSLTTDAPPIPPPLASPPPEIGIIAGNRNHHLSGLLLSRESDGRVEVESAKLEGMADFIVLPYKHTKVHTRRETAELIDRFLRTGKFLQQSSPS
jgi:pimeloyl-ACP methyl ester carboxylesterase